MLLPDPVMGNSSYGWGQSALLWAMDSGDHRIRSCHYRSRYLDRGMLLAVRSNLLEVLYAAQVGPH